MTTSENGINLIKSFEGLRLTAYKAVSTEVFYTIGYGHYGMDVKANDVITEEEATAYLRSDIRKAEDNVNSFDAIYQFNQNEFDALVSFAYNIGSINQLVCGGSRSRQAIREAWPLYNKAGGKVLQGLVNRREKELALFNTPVEADERTVEDRLKIVLECVKGNWGNGHERKRMLEAAGYNYEQVQADINKIYGALNGRNSNS